MKKSPLVNLFLAAIALVLGIFYLLSQPEGARTGASNGNPIPLSTTSHSTLTVPGDIQTAGGLTQTMSNPQNAGNPQKALTVKPEDLSAIHVSP